MIWLWMGISIAIAIGTIALSIGLVSLWMACWVYAADRRAAEEERKSLEELRDDIKTARTEFDDSVRAFYSRERTRNVLMTLVGDLKGLSSEIEAGRRSLGVGGGSGIGG